METINLDNDHGPNCRFQGEELAQVSSRGNDSTRWTELYLYRTRTGKLVCHEVGLSQWEGEDTRYSIHFAGNEKELVEAVGYGRLAKELYDAAGIDHAQTID